MTLTENSAKLRAAANTLDLAGLETALEARAELIASPGSTVEELREAMQSGEAARCALEDLKKSSALQSGQLGQMRSGFAVAGNAPRVEWRG